MAKRLEKVRSKVMGELQPEFLRRLGVLAVHSLARYSAPNNWRGGGDGLTKKGVRRLQNRIREDIAGGRRFPRAYVTRAGGTAAGGAFYDCAESKTGKVHLRFKGRAKIGRLQFVVPLNAVPAGVRIVSAKAVAARGRLESKQRKAVRRRFNGRGVVLVRAAEAEQLLAEEVARAGAFLGGWAPAARAFRSSKAGFFGSFAGAHKGSVKRDMQHGELAGYTVDNDTFPEHSQHVRELYADAFESKRAFVAASAMLRKKHTESVLRRVQRACGLQ